MPQHKLGRGARPTPRNVLAAATPHKITSLHPTQAITIPKTLSFWGNYSNGDCVSAEEAFAKACHNAEIFISESEVETWAEQHGVLNGANLVEVMNWMTTGGFTQGGKTYDDGAHFSVDWKDTNLLCNAIYQGPVKIGVGGDQLDTLWWAHGGSQSGGKNGWVATGFKEEKAEDHCVSLCGYGTIDWLAKKLGGTVPAGVNGKGLGFALFTWDSIGVIDVPSLMNITFEAWLRNPTTVIRAGLERAA